MKRLYAEQINKMLEDYYFNLENNPQAASRITAY